MTNEIKEIYEKAVEKRKKANFSTGFEDLDNFCKYLDSGDVLIIGGRPAMGKTNFAISLLNHLLSVDKNVLFFTPEQSKEQFVQRLLAEKMGISIYNIKDDKINKNELIDTIDWFSDKKIFINDNSYLTTDDIEIDIEKFKPEIVFVDYVQLLEAPKAPNRTEAINLVIKELKRIAVTHNVILILLSQLSRAVEGRCDKRPMLSDLRNGSLLEELSDIILFVYREEYYSGEMENPSNEIIVAKNSIGPTGIVSLDFKNGFFRNPKTDNTF